MERPIALTRDPGLADELRRLAAAAGVGIDVLASPGEALPVWTTAPVVLVGADLAGEVVCLAPVRRPGVSVVAWTPAPPGSFRDALLLGAERVAELPAASEWLAEALTDLGEGGRGDGLLVGVVGGSGGAGATTFACALAQVAADTGPALVVDLDPWGPGCDRLLALDQRPGVRWDSLARASGRLSARSLRDAVPRRDGPGVLGWPADPSGLPGAGQGGGSAGRGPDEVAVREALSAGRRGHAVVVVDLPRSPVPLVIETLARCDLVAVLAVPTITGVAAAARWVAAAPGSLRVGVVVRGRGLAAEQAADLVGARLLAEMANQRGLAEAVDLGLGPVRSRRGPLARAARQVLDLARAASSAQPFLPGAAA